MAAGAPGKPAHGLMAAVAGEDARRELRSWLGLAVAALAIAGVFALLVALSRVPGISSIPLWPTHFFEKGLVIHVAYSFVIWFLCLLAALATVATYWLDGGKCRGRATGKTAVTLVGTAQVLMLAPALVLEGEASLNNYVPTLMHPVYYLGLVFLFLSLLFVVIRLVAAFFRRVQPATAPVLGILAAGVIYAAAFACLTVTFHTAWGEVASAEVNERLFWGMGHVLQFVNTALMAVAWYWLAETAGRAPSARLFVLALTALAAFALIGPALYALYPMYGPEQTMAFTDLQYLLAPTPVVLAAGLLLAGGTGSAPGPEAALARRALWVSVALFGLGGLLGLFVDGADTRTPAHYHGVIGGVNLALMGLTFCLLLPLVGRAPAFGRAARTLVWLYGAGQALHSLGLFAAGGYGAPRKVAGEVAGLEAIGAQVALYAMGVGAVIAIAGGVMFIWIAGRCLLRPDPPPATGAGPSRQLKI